MLNIVGCQAAEFLVMLNEPVYLFAEKVDVLFIPDHLYFAAAGYKFQFGKIFSDDFEVTVVDAKKLNGVERVNGDNYFAQLFIFLTTPCNAY